ncbi:MAG: repressor protein [Candidatus Komeilibacteria bacterium RIFCSPLOWO2_02_FULL_48_11]|uniref:Repressor protein n=1 Tax=Candidatus Komeilibacteria bacterium RIFCSPLOWO2_02_FULL_48_11 TaxID=1798553 RepID=A0A1G2BU08_9BACT|nr:MAG: repressor protein [Candidatus Komeilibacteria bacterium RIFCSPLOWO2_02_FULL_48_11]
MDNYMLAKFIQEQRKKHNLTQEFLASEIGISRPTYMQIEQGERDLTITEARKLADIFSIAFTNFLQGKDSSAIVKIEKSKKSAKETEQEIRISVPQKNLNKFKEVLLYVLSKVGSKPNVGETVLYKLLYFIDFDYYEKFEEQLIGATYIKNHFGPTPVEFKAIVDDMIKKGEIAKVESKYFNHAQKKYLPVRDPDLTKLKDARELRHIDEVLARLSDKNAAELSVYSHEDVPWLVAEDNKPLDYEAVFYRAPKTSVRNYDEQD